MTGTLNKEEHIIVVEGLYDKFLDNGYWYAWPHAYEVSNITEAARIEAKGKAIYYTLSDKTATEYEKTPVYLGERERESK